MARLPRLVLPGHPYHVTQRGNRRQPTFFGDDDYALYRGLLAEAADKGHFGGSFRCQFTKYTEIATEP